MLKGYKTYLMAALVLIYGLTGFLTGHMTGTEALGVILSSGVISTLRAGIDNAMQKWVFAQDVAIDAGVNARGSQNNN